MKDIIPSFLRVPGSRARTYLWRLGAWHRVNREIVGKDSADRAVLRRAQMRSPITSLRMLDRWQDPQVEENCTVTVAGVGEFRVRARTDDLYHVLPSREGAIHRCIKEVLRSGDNFIDAGANIGVYTVLASRLVGPTGRVIAVEMMPDTAAILREHVERNGCANVTVVENALSDTPDQIVEAYVETGKHGQATISGRKVGTAISVRTTTLANLLRDLGSIALMKMDLEGVEAPALLGAGEALDRVNRIIFEDREGSARIRAILTARGFHLRPLDRGNTLAVRPVP